MPFSTAISAWIAARDDDVARRTGSGSRSGCASRVARSRHRANRPMSWLVRFFSAAWARRLPSQPSSQTSSDVEAVEGGDEFVVAECRRRSTRTSRATRSSWSTRPPSASHVDVAVDDGVLEVVHRVGDVVGQVHDLRLDAPDAGPVRRRAASRTRPCHRCRSRTSRRPLGSATRRSAGHGYLQLASRLARVRLSPYAAAVGRRTPSARAA